MHFTVLYTKQVQQKRKRWADGFARVEPSGKVALFDEAGCQLGTGRLKASVASLTADSEGASSPDAANRRERCSS